MTARIHVLIAAGLIFVAPGGHLWSARAEDPPKLRSLEKAPPPDQKSETPKTDEWKSAERVELMGELPGNCKALLLREWLQIRCARGDGAAFSVISGSTDGVTAMLTPDRHIGDGQGHSEEVDGHSVTMLPIRRGDRRVLQLTVQVGSGYEGFAHEVLFIVSEQWLDDQPGPWVVVTQPMPKK